MANIKSAAKAHKQSEKRRIANVNRRSALKTTIKKLHATLAAAPTSPEVHEILRSIAAQLARARSKRVIARNAASRTLSRLSVRVNKAQASAA